MPYVRDGKTVFVLDIDSDTLADFDGIDQLYLERLVGLIGKSSA